MSVSQDSCHTTDLCHLPCYRKILTAEISIDNKEIWRYPELVYKRSKKLEMPR